MGSRMSLQNELDVYRPETLVAIHEAFDASWTALRATDPFRNFANDGDLRALLCEKLFALAGDGVTDSGELRRLALESLALKHLPL
jgi:hypothetical protein